ncbi:MAG: ribosome maturation factor RimP [Gammaproteobacteria bacterium]|nr:ribosome maturation factor RimP [Gammaproteobacteria bacterium]
MWSNGDGELNNQQLEELLRPGAEALGFELVMAELTGSGDPVLRVYIDRPEGVNVEDCARVSQQISGILDVEDPIAGAYQLEVSSPGLDRPLVRPEHFRKVLGEIVRVRMQHAFGERRRYKGVLREVTEEAVTLEVDGEPVALPFAQMDKSRLVPNILGN